MMDTEVRDADVGGVEGLAGRAGSRRNSDDVEFEVVGADGTSRLVLHGDFDPAESSAMWLTLVGLVAIPGHTVELDMSEVGFFGSVGLRTIRAAWRESRRAGSTFRIVALPERSRRVFALAGLAPLLPPGDDRVGVATSAAVDR